MMTKNSSINDMEVEYKSVAKAGFDSVSSEKLIKNTVLLTQIIDLLYFWIVLKNYIWL